MAITATTMTMDDLRSRRFEALFEAHHGAVRAYALRRADAETAGDAVADTFLVAWRRLDDIPDEPLPWLYGVARRALADQHRSARRRFVLRERAAAHATASAEADIPDRLGERDAARAALATLSATNREALALVAW
ncbi:MAG: RNA polymerase sigma factor [Solirubrobacteraceae bacterium]